MQWNPQKYLEFSGHRGRPYLDLLAQIGAESPRRVVDVGCGPGNLTALLPARWPTALISALDSSPEMVAQASQVPGISVSLGDAAEFRPGADCDVIISNAVLQWVPDHLTVLENWAASLTEGAWLAFQVPDNFDAPAHTLMRELAESPRWAGQLAGILRHHDWVARPEEYSRRLRACGLSTDVWQTTYLHLLEGENPVLEWVRGTGYRPIVQALSASDAAEFEADYAARLREAYPVEADGLTPFPFRRTFCVAQKR